MTGSVPSIACSYLTAVAKGLWSRWNRGQSQWECTSVYPRSCLGQPPSSPSRGTAANKQADAFDYKKCSNDLKERCRRKFMKGGRLTGLLKSSKFGQVSIIGEGRHTMNVVVKSKTCRQERLLWVKFSRWAQLCLLYGAEDFKASSSEATWLITEGICVQLRRMLTAYITNPILAPCKAESAPLLPLVMNAAA